MECGHGYFIHCSPLMLFTFRQVTYNSSYVENHCREIIISSRFIDYNYVMNNIISLHMN